MCFLGILSFALGTMQVAVLSKGGIPPLLSALSRFSADLDVMHALCKALYIICRGDAIVKV